MKNKLHAGKTLLHVNDDSVCGGLALIDGEDFYRIENHDRMRPFLMSIVSSSDHWMFVSSNGALTAGRGTPDLALFPYYTDDKIHDSVEITGPKTVMMVRRRGRDFLWEPFSERLRGLYRTRRNLYKSLAGDKLIFEEINLDLGLAFRYGWSSSEHFGFVRRARLKNSGTAGLHVRLLDGMQNLMPCGVGSQFQLEKSTLIDAYKKNELVARTGLGLFALSSIPIDRPEPAEALKTTTVWMAGLDRCATLLSSVQVENFRHGLPIKPEHEVRAERGAYFVEAEVKLGPGRGHDWLMAADVNQGPVQIAQLNRHLRRPKQLQKLVEADIARGRTELLKLVASADGLQKTSHQLGNARHFGNVLFNIMRGGVVVAGEEIDVVDLFDFIRLNNRKLAAKHAKFFRKLGKYARLSNVLESARATGSANLERLCREYLPLTFSRRHGDPSRPWNRFAIAPRAADGARILNYEGNWRDIFQNWEALAVSFPGFAAGMVCRFVNASTADGYNPYRITRAGVDWEVVDPEDPWSHIGYWGDHQIIYLLKLLEILGQHEPSTLRELLTRRIFCYANVPYRIKPYRKLLANPRETVVFDPVREELVRRRMKSDGADGKLIWTAAGQVYLVNLTEKLLVSLLAKISNFIPEAGIWLNTQRPEWNDANNALVGNGVSVVTLFYLQRHLAFCQGLFGSLADSEISISAEVARCLSVTHKILKRHARMLDGSFGDQNRRQLLDKLGQAGSGYRDQIYRMGFSGRQVAIGKKRLQDFIKLALAFVEHSIRANKRPDGLYHSYNLAGWDKGGELSIRRLYPMLEGQVAALSSGRLSVGESIRLLTTLKRSDLYRADQHSYLLYPNRQLPRFVEKNNVPKAEIARSRLLQTLLASGNRILVERDVTGTCHFNATITNARDLESVLQKLSLTGQAHLVGRERAPVREIFERLFNHQSFTGRSGSFFGYEGLGCIYWHMVSKLLLAVQETFFRAHDSGAPAPLLRKLAASYYDIRSGLGDAKSPAVYGAFPMDAYSHTPAQAGARQPGLTGQVKEDILCRKGELGIFVEEGQIHFRPLLLKRSEFLCEPGGFDYYDIEGIARNIRLPAKSLAFTWCQVPVIYRLGLESSTQIHFIGRATVSRPDLNLDAGTSQSIFQRAGKVRYVVIFLNESDNCLMAE